MTKYPEELTPTYYGTEVTDDIKDNKFKRQLGKKAYELKDHLGNVRVTFSDIKMPTGTTNPVFDVDLLSKFEYYPGGMPIFDLKYQNEVTRYGFNKGSEIDREILPQEDRAFSTYFREGDTYTLRWWSQDPKRNELPHQSTYSYMDANPIWKNDPMGDQDAKFDAAQTQKNAIFFRNTYLEQKKAQGEYISQETADGTMTAVGASANIVVGTLEKLAALPTAATAVVDGPIGPLASSALVMDGSFRIAKGGWDLLNLFTGTENKIQVVHIFQHQQI